jgi:ribosome biogenesis GTPase / thiamine phosphate phosphatase
MSKGKGKSRRRRKDWQAHYEAGQDIEHASRDKLSAREVKLREDAYAGPAGAEPADDPAGLETIEAMVTGLFRRGIFVRDGSGEELYCGIAKTFRPPEGYEHTSPLAIGDAVTVALVRDEHVDGQVELDRNRMDGMVLRRAMRRTILSRPAPRSAKRNEAWQQRDEKVLAANMDCLLMVCSVASPPLRRGLIDRLMIAAQRGELEPILAINKIDLARPDQTVIEDYRSQDVRVVCCSAETGEGLDELSEAIGAKRSVLAGASGVGKSTLVNALIPEADAVTRTVRSKDQRGRHTTSQSRLYDLPGGGLVIDTPGVRELAVAIEPEELSWYFPEFEEYLAACKFRDCTHTHEPGCGVQAAVEAGEIPARRYESYRRIFESLGE